VEGHNGSGKSTLLRILSTALRPTAGRIALFGRDIAEDADWARSQLALMACNPGLYDDLTARENLHFAADMLGRSHAGVTEVLDRVGLLREAEEKVRTFSSGMQRRLALGRLLLQKPRVLLLDEPYNSFDRAGVALVNEVVRDVIQQDGGCAVIVLHDRQSALGLLDRVETMRQGRIDAPGDPVVPREGLGDVVLAAGGRP
jgi:heme exporter protein A